MDPLYFSFPTSLGLWIFASSFLSTGQSWRLLFSSSTVSTLPLEHTGLTQALFKHLERSGSVLCWWVWSTFEVQNIVESSLSFYFPLGLPAFPLCLDTSHGRPGLCGWRGLPQPLLRSTQTQLGTPSLLTAQAQAHSAAAPLRPCLPLPCHVVTGVAHCFTSRDLWWCCSSWPGKAWCTQTRRSELGAAQATMPESHSS